ncbi:MAG: hypothetical protein QOC70_103 [Verrucomicrobiota bacterium]|jgi:hypothetical protein
MSTGAATTDPRPLAQRLAAFGCTSFIRLDQKLSVPTQLDYLDLLPTRSNGAPILTAVAEHQGTALLYVVDEGGAVMSDLDSLAEVRRQLANRSDPAWLGLLRPGSLEIFPIGFHEQSQTRPIRVIEEDSAAAPLFFQGLVHGTFEENSRLRGTDYVFHKIFDLLTQTTNQFVPREGRGALDALEVLSMAGRALFFRFLIDRRIILEMELHGDDGICPAARELKDAFSTAEKAAQTSAWLDATFNGDFLPLIDESIANDDRPARETEYLRFYKRVQRLVGKSIFDHLEAILRGWREVGGGFQPELDWGDLDFSHIPVGVLSQVYESFSHRADPRTARDTSVHYTPRTIAGLMVEEAFAAVKEPARAKVLDGACGAGIFLVLAFRRLVREQWIRNEERPKTALIQKILYNQLCGFDISEAALRLASLSLYITAIELNASPRPPRSLKFPRNVRGGVLHRFGVAADRGGKDGSFPLGSLGPEVSRDFDKTFDIVIGNPPWTRLRDEQQTDDNTGNSQTGALNAAFTAIGRRVLATRGLDHLARRYENPDKNPDIPFLWRAMEWTKADGIIALAMPARLFGRTSGKGLFAWRAVLRSVEVTGLINGADLRKTAVWDGIDMPFCVVFARNKLPDPSHRFEFAAPTYEPDLNSGGRFRIDYGAAQPISVATLKNQPWLLKTLSLGTWLDVQVMEALTQAFSKTLTARWSDWDATAEKTGQGYNRSPKLRQKWFNFLGKLKVFEPPKEGFSIEYSSLQKYSELHGQDAEGRSSAHGPRRPQLYQPPLVIIPKAPGDNPASPKAYFSTKALAFSQSNYGYSCAGHPQAQTLASLLYLVAHSTLFRYFVLMVSVSQGADHMIFTKQDFDALPFPDVNKLAAATRTRIENLAHRLEHDVHKPLDELDELLFGLYGLDADAVQVAKDTLFSAASYRKVGRAALNRTTRETRTGFVQALYESLEPYFSVCGEHVAVREPGFQPDTWRQPWFFLAVSREEETVPVNPSLLRIAMEVANRRGCSRLIVHAPNKQGLLLGLLNERRWWTATRARLCAQHIIRERIGAFGLPENA